MPSDSDSAQQELERAATAILADLTHAGLMPSQWSYQQVHTIVAAAYGKGYIAGMEFTQRIVENAAENISQALDAGL